MAEPRINNSPASGQASQGKRISYTRPEVRIRSNKGATEAGMTDKEIKALFAEEERFLTASKGKYEVAAVVDQNGVLNPRGNPMVKGFTRRPTTKEAVTKAMAEVEHGTENTVFTRKDRIPESSVYTHYHPWDEKRHGTGLGAKIGTSLSGKDFAAAVKRNDRIARARTENYIFAIHRPKTGWPVSGEQLEREWTRLYNSDVKQMADWIRSQPLTYEEQMVRWGRLNALASHHATQELAKRYGIQYTRRRAN